MKDSDLRRVLGLTWAGWLNFLVLQWTCFRLFREVERDGSVSGWALRWSPIWRDGWTLPSWRKARLPRLDTEIVRRGLCGGTYTVRADSAVRFGEVAFVDDDGDLYAGDKYTSEHERAVGTWLTDAKRGEIATVEICFRGKDNA